MVADRQGLSGKGAWSLSSRQCRTVERVLVSAITGGGFIVKDLCQALIQEPGQEREHARGWGDGDSGDYQIISSGCHGIDPIFEKEIDLNIKKGLPWPVFLRS